jgi:hypothetical protein
LPDRRSPRSQRFGEAVYVLHGRIEYRIGKQGVLASDGTCVFAPAPVAHSFRSVSASEARHPAVGSMTLPSPTSLVNDIERRRAERQQLQAQNPDRYVQLLEILFRQDPIEINYADNTDEYDPGVGTILPRLSEARSAADVGQIVREELERWFGMTIANRSPERIRGAADEIWQAWQHHCRQ